MSKRGKSGRARTVATALFVCALAGALGTAPAGSRGPPGPVTGPIAGTLDEGPTVRVGSPVELKQLLLREPPFRGRILIPANARWTMTDPCGHRDEFGRCVTTALIELPVRDGVKIVGERGYLNSRPVLRWPFNLKTSVFVMTGDGSRIEGLHMVGPKPTRDHATSEDFFTAIHVQQHAGKVSENVGPPRRMTVADNELEQWSGGGVLVSNVSYSFLREQWDREYTVPTRDLVGHHCYEVLPSQWAADCAKPTRALIGHIRVERNYLHDNAMDGAGYGVKVTGGGWATIEGNVFDTNRHAVEGLGYAYSGYSARFNYVLQGGVRQGCCWNQHFDMHGTASDGYGGYAGEWVEIAYNTIRGE